VNTINAKSRMAELNNNFSAPELLVSVGVGGNFAVQKPKIKMSFDKTGINDRRTWFTNTH
jgi:hypothetical protein